MYYKLNLGSNIITYCDAALYVEGIQVFRFYSCTNEGRLIVDFDIRDGEGNKLAVISKSEIIYSVEGFVFKELPHESFLKACPVGSSRLRFLILPFPMLSFCFVLCDRMPLLLFSCE